MRSTFLFLLACGTTLAYDLPPSLKALYNNLTSPEAPKCSSYIDKRSNLHDGHGGKGFGFCIDIPGAVYIAGPKSGELADMDVDCN